MKLNVNLRGTLLYSAGLIIFVGCSSTPSEKMHSAQIGKIAVGMKLDSVVQIMGKPDEVSIVPVTKDQYEYLYFSSSDYRDDFHIFISVSDSLVTSIVDGEF